jgi:hypothetical protein
MENTSLRPKYDEEPVFGTTTFVDNSNLEKKAITEFTQKPFKGKKYFLADAEKKGQMRVIFGELLENSEPFEWFTIIVPGKRTVDNDKLKIAEDNNRILNHSCTEKTQEIGTDKIVHRKINHNKGVTEEFLLRYLAIKEELDTRGDIVNVEYKFFINELINIIIPDMWKLVMDYVKKVYIGDMNSGIDMTNHRFSMDTTFFDEDMQEICYIKYTSGLLLPLVIHYCHIRKDVNVKDFLDFFYMELFSRSNYITRKNVYQRLHNYISGIVGNCFKNNSITYEKMAIASVTKESIIEFVFSRIITGNINKVDPIDSLIGYIAKVAKMNVLQSTMSSKTDMFQFIPFTDATPNSSLEDSIASKAEMIDSEIDRNDESMKIIRKVSIEDTINKIAYRYGIFVDSVEEIKFTKKHLVIHPIQTKIIGFLFWKPFTGISNIYDINRNNYVKLLLLAEKYLRKNGLNVMADYIMAKDTGYVFQRKWDGKNSDKVLMELPAYQELRNGKYKNVKAWFDEKNFIKYDCTQLANNRYEYNGFNDGAKFGKEIEHTEVEIMNEVLEFYAKLV